MRSRMSLPLLVDLGENHCGEWALRSPVMIVFGREVAKFMQFVMVWSSLSWFGFVESSGGM